MLKKTLALAAAATFIGGSAFAAAPVKGKNVKKAPVKTAAAKVVEVTVCPMTGEKLMGAGGGTERVGNYNVHFCCSGCKPDFDKLSAKDKQAKIQAALKKQNAKKPA